MAAVHAFVATTQRLTHTHTHTQRITLDNLISFARCLYTHTNSLKCMHAYMPNSRPYLCARSDTPGSMFRMFRRFHLRPTGLRRSARLGSTSACVGFCCGLTREKRIFCWPIIHIAVVVALFPPLAGRNASSPTSSLLFVVDVVFVRANARAVCD